MNNVKIPIEQIEKAFRLVRLIAEDREHVTIGVPASGRGIEICFHDRDKKLHTLIFDSDTSYLKQEEWNIL